MFLKNICKTRFLTLFIFLSYINLVFSQTISGKITADTGKNIVSANVIFKESPDSDQIVEFILAKNGHFTIDLKKQYKTIYVEINSTGYTTLTTEIKAKTGEKVNVDFILKEQKIQNIQEVVIKKSNEAFTIKEDTVSYNVSQYKDPSDRKIQDVLKKMPGITVNEKTGEIKYKGKSVETVKLEGDDLFGNNYTLGTRNINVDIVDKVEAIENYSENALLKGIEASDKVALNLKIKKGKIDLSGNIDWASGFNSNNKQVSAINSTLLQISKNFKSFLNFSYNNIGINQTPYDYFSNSLSIDQQRNQDYNSNKILSDVSFNSNILDDNKVNRNNALFSSYNLIFKPFKNNSTRVNLAYLNDRLSQNIYNESIIIDDNYVISDDFSSIKKPELFKIDINSKTNTSKNSLLEYKLTSSSDVSETTSTIIQNGNKNFDNYLVSKNKFIKQNLEYTYRINKSSALQINGIYSFNDIPQSLFSTPNFIVNENFSFNTQLSNFKKQIIDFQLLYLGKSKNLKYFFALGNSNERNKYVSGLEGFVGSMDTEQYSNHFINQRTSYYSFGQINFSLSKLLIQPSYNLVYLKQTLTQQNLESDKILLEPKLFLRYKLNNVSFLNTVVEYKQKPFSEERLIPNPVFTSIRSNSSSIPTLEIQKTFNTNINYTINNLYKQLNVNFGLFYTKDIGNYFPEISISPYMTSYRYFYSSNSRKNYGVDFLFDKYVSFVDSVIKVGSNYTISNYENIVNNSELRKINNHSFNSEIVWRTVFNSNYNFENKLSYHINRSNVEGGIQNNLKSLSNRFKVIAKPLKKLSIIPTVEYFLPDTTKKINYFFVDATLKYIANRNWEFSILAKNLLNKKVVSEIDVNDYSINTTNTVIIPRYFMLNITYNF